MSRKTRLELTWIGKDERPRLEPRILIEEPSKSYLASTRGKNDLFDNILVRGDNLLALKSLEQQFTGAVKCIYIDPPFNTGAAFEHYDDGVEHSLWLSLMAERIRLLRGLLREDGAIFVHLDDNELDYCKVLLDEIFGRANFINRITIDARAPSAFSTVNPGVFKASEYLLWYAKDRSHFLENSARVAREPDYAYNKWLVNPQAEPADWKLISVLEAYEAAPKPRTRHPKSLLDHFNKFMLDNASRCCRLASISDTGAGQSILELKRASLKKPGELLHMKREGDLDDVYVLDGQQLIFYSKNVIELDGKLTATKLLTNIWTDIAWEGIAGEGGVQFKKGKKPEKLIRRCLDLTTAPGDLVLDSFGGSGTTAAVAHKMHRRWITIEFGDQADTHILSRMKSVIDGADKGGISDLVNWSGGGGFRYYCLAPSLIETDRWGNRIISSKYNPAMLAEAVCKHLGFTYAPSADPRDYWKHGYSSERDFIYVTTASLTAAALRGISEDVGPDRTLLICCKAFDAKVDAFDNLTIKKIPQAVLANCEWGRDDYSLRISQLPEREEEPDSDENTAKPRRSKAKPADDSPSLFDGDA